jgi:Transcription factor IIIC subunit delta N-term
MAKRKAAVLEDPVCKEEPVPQQRIRGNGCTSRPHAPVPISRGAEAGINTVHASTQLGQLASASWKPNGLFWAADGRLAQLSDTAIAIHQLVLQDPDAAKERPTQRGCTLTHRIAAKADKYSVGMCLHGKAVGSNTPADVNVQELLYDSHVLGRPRFSTAAWSPLACAWDGGCLLAALDAAHTLRVYEPPRQPSQPTWSAVACISAAALRHAAQEAGGDPAAAADVDAEGDDIKDEQEGPEPLDADSDDSYQAPKQPKVGRKGGTADQPAPVAYAPGTWETVCERSKAVCLAWLPRKLQTSSLSTGDSSSSSSSSSGSSNSSSNSSQIAVLAVGGRVRLALWALHGAGSTGALSLQQQPLWHSDTAVQAAGGGSGWLAQLAWCGSTDSNTNLLAVAESSGAVVLLAVNTPTATATAGSITIEPYRVLRPQGSQPAQILSYLSADTQCTTTTATAGTLAVACAGVLTLYPLAAGAAPRYWCAHSHSITAVQGRAWSDSPGHSQLVTAAMDGTVQLWSVPLQPNSSTIATDDDVDMLDSNGSSSYSSSSSSSAEITPSSLQLHPSDRRPVVGAALSPHGLLVAYLHRQGDKTHAEVVAARTASGRRSQCSLNIAAVLPRIAIPATAAGSSNGAGSSSSSANSSISCWSPVVSAAASSVSSSSSSSSSGKQLLLTEWAWLLRWMLGGHLHVTRVSWLGGTGECLLFMLLPHISEPKRILACSVHTAEQYSSRSIGICKLCQHCVKTVKLYSLCTLIPSSFAINIPRVLHL